MEGNAKICTKCGAVISHGTKFCSNCGHDLASSGNEPLNGNVPALQNISTGGENGAAKERAMNAIGRRGTTDRRLNLSWIIMPLLGVIIVDGLFGSVYFYGTSPRFGASLVIMIIALVLFAVPTYLLIKGKRITCLGKRI